MSRGRSGWGSIGRAGLLLLGAAAALLVPGNATTSPEGALRRLLLGLPGPAAPARKRPPAIREVTAYNVGVPGQTGEDPCIGASGHDLCALVGRGLKVCAANFVPLGTVLRIEGHGEFIVLDRVHGRFPARVDIAMGQDKVDEAVAFGVRRLRVEIRN